MLMQTMGLMMEGSDFGGGYMRNAPSIGGGGDIMGPLCGHGGSDSINNIPQLTPLASYGGSGYRHHQRRPSSLRPMNIPNDMAR